MPEFRFQGMRPGGRVGGQAGEGRLERNMSDIREKMNIKEKMTAGIQCQPEDATYEEIMRELAFERMIERGMEDSRNERVISNEEMERRIRTWRR